GLHIAKKVGIINWELDMKAFRAFLHQHLLVMRDAYNAKNAPVLTQLLDTLSAIMQKHGITLSSIRQVADGAPLGDDDMPANRMDYGIVEADSNSLPHEVYARHEPFSGLMYVRTTTFNKFAGENAFAIRQEAIRANVMERGTTTKRLTGGTMLHAVDARFDCYVFRHRDLLEQVAPPVAKSQSNVTQLSR
ncbi:MAG TPA: hypothetical protein VFM98_17170, partial [Ramlibacter sp.]|uniref:hypothetical protein n=1 Tax=Ramlibacter sp. TaxID=1917967 RepID=UPI002D7FB732